MGSILSGAITSSADEVVVCGGVFTNRGCRPVGGAGPGTASDSDTSPGTASGMAPQGALGEPRPPLAGSGVVDRELIRPAEEILRPVVAGRAESFSLLRDERAAMPLGKGGVDGISADRAGRMGRIRVAQLRSGGDTVAQRSTERSSFSSKQRNNHHHANGSDDDQVKTKATLVKALRAQQAECRLPECLPALALEEAIERCGSLEVNYSSCRQEAAMVLGKVAKAREQQRRAQFDEDRHRLELERLRQRGIKLSLDEARQRRGDGRQVGDRRHGGG